MFAKVAPLTTSLGRVLKSVEIAVGLLQLSVRTLHEGEDVLYRRHIRQKRALCHLLAVDLHTDVFQPTETKAGRTDPMFVHVGGRAFIYVVFDRIPHLHDKVGLAQSHEVVRRANVDTVGERWVVRIENDASSPLEQRDFTFCPFLDQI